MDASHQGHCPHDAGIDDTADASADMAARLLASSRFSKLSADVQSMIMAPLLALSDDDLIAYGDRLLGAKSQRLLVAA